VTGRNAGLSYVLGDVTIVGRSSGATIQIVDEAISRQHFAVQQAEGGYSIEDLGSQNGTVLNGVRLTGPRRLQKDDVIGAGPHTFVFDPSIVYLRADRADVIISEAPEEAAARVVRGDEGTSDEKVLFEIVARALSGAGAKNIVEGAIEVVARRFGAERAFILSAPKGERPRVLASFGPGPITVSRTIVARALEQSAAIVSGDAAGEIAFSGGKSLVMGEIRSLLAAPLLADGRAIGMVHLDRTKRGMYGPPDLERLIPLANLLALVVLAAEGIDALKRSARARHRIEAPRIVAASASMKALIALAEKAAEADATVSITGETGTGKEAIARLIHALSPRAEGPFVAVNCGALPESLQESELFGHEKGAFTGASSVKVGLFEAASRGTLFLDEVAECSKATQVKLLRAIQERAILRLGGTRPIEVDVRIVSATSRRLEDLIAQGAFRDDLYYRLRVVHLVVPPLRDRAEDIEPLALHFASKMCAGAGISEKTLEPELFDALRRASWPGNVRELANTIERLVMLSEGPSIGLADLPPDLLAASAARDATTSGDTLEAAVGRVEREMILRALARTKANKSATADALGISRVTLDKKLEVHGIEWPKRRR
jgi:DNA-binding NtrC family response regulator